VNQNVVDCEAGPAL